MPRTQRFLGTILVALATLGPPGSVQAGHAKNSDPTQLPNLVPLPPYEVQIAPADDGLSTALRFTAATANRGAYALDLLAVRTGAQTADAHQCTEWATHRVCLTRENVGEFIWREEHNHYHFEDFALYELRRLDDEGGVDMSEEGLVAGGEKASFCLIDYERDGPASHPLYQQPYAVYWYACLTNVGYQGISPGWRDAYGAYLPGQQIVIDGVEPGTYALVQTADPDDRLLESDETDNVAFQEVQIE